MFYQKEIHTTWNNFFYRDDIKKELDIIYSQVGLSIKHEYLYTDEKEIDKYYFPCEKYVFRVFKSDLKKIKYLILGMDPYPSYFFCDKKIIPTATGRSFEIQNKKSFKDKIAQSSLTNILKTLYYDKFKTIENISNIREKICEFDDIKKYLHIKNVDTEKLNILNIKNWFLWTQMQGVLWLNSSLTVKPNHSGSHIKIWEYFINELLKYIDENINIKYLVWGENAYERIKNIISNKKIIKFCHPATRNNNTFIIDNCFKYMKDINFYK